MPFQIIRNDITKVKADAIVNTANPKPRIGRGTDSAIYAAAGEEQLLAERKKIGEIAPGQAVSTDAFNLDAKYTFIRSGLHGWMVIMASEIFSTPAMRSLLLRRRS